jgi:hypothetical protein
MDNLWSDNKIRNAAGNELPSPKAVIYIFAPVTPDYNPTYNSGFTLNIAGKVGTSGSSDIIDGISYIRSESHTIPDIEVKSQVRSSSNGNNAK